MSFPTTKGIVRDPTKAGYAERSGHWYGRNGEPHYTVIGSSTGTPRPTRITDARKEGWVPGVTTILNMEAKPALTAWLVNQGILAALTLPRADGESDTSYCDRVREDAGAQAREAAIIGTKIHDGLETFYRDGDARNVPADVLKWVLPVTECIERLFPKGTWFAEESYAHKNGYACRIDLRGFNDVDRFVIDFKCKEFTRDDIYPPAGSKKRAKILAWPEHMMQLWANSRAFDPTGYESIVRANFFVSTKEPELVIPVVYMNTDTQQQLEAFDLLLRLWQIRNDYNTAWEDK
jgi:hypothetical protein